MKKIIISISIIIIVAIAFTAPWLWLDNGENIMESSFFRGNDIENFKKIKDGCECDGSCINVKWVPFGVTVDACSEDYYFISFWGQRFYMEPALDQSKEISSTTDDSNVSVIDGKYTNKTWNYSVDIPEGYSIRTADNDGLVYIMAQTTPNGDTFTDMTIISKRGGIEPIVSTENIEMVSQEDIVVNGVKGIKTDAIYYCSPNAPRCTCSKYQLEHDGFVYEFETWECLASNIFEDVIQSFQIVE